jgi:hypothetical protein
MVRFRIRGCLLFLLLVSPGCGPTVDLTKGLQIVDVSSGWFDAGIVNGKAKLVPSVSFKLKNVSDQKLTVLQVNALFRRASEKDEWGSGFVQAAGSEGLAPGVTTNTLTMKSDRGYTGTDQTRQQMLENKYFVDAKVELSGKYGSTQWVRLGDFPITRVLIVK